MKPIPGAPASTAVLSGWLGPVCLLTLLAAVFAQAAENRWSNSRGGGKWENGANWSLGVAPNINHDVLIALGISAPAVTVTIDGTTAALLNNMVISSLRVGRSGGFSVASDALNLFNAGLTTPLTVLSSTVISNKGIVTITGSILDVEGAFTVNGSVGLNSGSILNANDGLALHGGGVTLNSNSVLNVKGNNFPAYDFMVEGSMTLNGGSLNFSNFIASGMAIGNLGRGTLNIFGGELRTAGGTFLHVGAEAGSVGTLTIAGGIARLEGENASRVGVNAGSTGSVLVAGGELITRDTGIGGHGVGQLTVSNGIWRANPPNSVGVGSNGTVTLAGGTSVFSGMLSVDGSLLITGGTLLTTNSSVGVRGVAVISNGVWRAMDVGVGSAFEPSRISQIAFASGSTTISSSLRIGDCGLINSMGLVTVSGGELIVTNALTNATLQVLNGTFRLEGGTVIVDKIDLTSPCARFERSGGTLIYRTAILDPMRDDDGDGAPNGLEQSNGFDPLDPDDKRDTDGDGVPDAEELLAGTDHRNSNSVVKIILILPQGEDVRLRWKTVAGKTNIIQAAESLGASSSFADLATIVIPGTGDRTNTFIEPEGAIKGPSRVYRVKVIP